MESLQLCAILEDGRKTERSERTEREKGRYSALSHHEFEMSGPRLLQGDYLPSYIRKLIFEESEMFLIPKSRLINLKSLVTYLDLFAC